jgi:hypothetical protein
VQKKIRSLMEELNELASKKDKEVALEARATHIINSAINLFLMIRENFEPEAAYELERRFVNSVRTGDPNKFTRSIRRLRENKETLNKLTIIDGDLKQDDD